MILAIFIIILYNTYIAISALLLVRIPIEGGEKMIITIGNLSLKTWWLVFIVLTLCVWMVGRCRYRLSRDGKKINKRLRSIWIMAVVLFATIAMVWIICQNEKPILLMSINGNERSGDPLSLAIVMIFLVLTILTWFAGVASVAATRKYLRLAKKVDKNI